VDIEKYPIPSPKRVLGIKSTTIVLLAVVDTPHAAPWKSRNNRRSHIILRNGYRIVMTIKAALAQMARLFLWLSIK
jgi:hypothetical protein